MAKRVSWNCSSRSSAACFDSRFPMPNRRPWKYRFSQLVSWRSRVFCWDTTPIICLAKVGWATTSIPPTNAWPDEGITLVVRTPTVVVFPAPLGPSSP